MGNFKLAGSTLTGAFGTTPDAEWAVDSVASGVKMAVKFDNQSIITANYTNSNQGTGPNRVSLDTTQKVFSGGCMAFTYPQGIGTGDTTGNWQMPFTGIGQGETLYMRMRLYIESQMYTNSQAWGDGTDWKLWILHEENQLTNGPVEFTTKGTSGDCVYFDAGPGARTQDTSPNFMPSGTPHTFQSGWNIDAGGPPWTNEANAWPQRNYPTRPDPWPTDQWFVIYHKLTIGTWTQANSRLETWTKAVGGPLRKKLSVRNLVLQRNFTNSTYSNLFITGYMTPSGGDGNASVQSKLRYSDVIISTSPIAMPTV